MLVRPYLAYNWEHICVHGEIETIKFKYMKKLLSILLGLMFMTSCGLKELKESVEERERQEQVDEPEVKEIDNLWKEMAISMSNINVDKYNFGKHSIRESQLKLIPNSVVYGTYIRFFFTCDICEKSTHSVEADKMNMSVIIDKRKYQLNRYDRKFDLEYLLGNGDELKNPRRVLIEITFEYDNEYVNALYIVEDLNYFWDLRNLLYGG